MSEISGSNEWIAARADIVIANIAGMAKDEPAGRFGAADLRELADECRRLRVRVAELEAQLRDGMPSGTNTKDLVPQDQKPYRVWTRSHVVEWKSGPNVWVARDEHDHVDAIWYAHNPDGWLPEPEQSGEGGS